MQIASIQFSEQSEVRDEDFGVTNLIVNMAATQNFRLVSHFFNQICFLENTSITVTLVMTHW